MLKMDEAKFKALTDFKRFGQIEMKNPHYVMVYTFYLKKNFNKSKGFHGQKGFHVWHMEVCHITTQPTTKLKLHYHIHSCCKSYFV